MNADSDDYYYKKDWFVIKHSSNHYLIWHNRMANTWEIIRDNLNYFEAIKLVKILDKLKGK